MNTNNTETNLLKLENDAETMEVFQEFALDFFTFIRLNPEKWKVLEKLKENGNEKAGDIIKYINSFSPGVLFNEKREAFLKNAKNTVLLVTPYGALDLKWSDFDFVTEKSLNLVKFTCEILIHKEIFSEHIYKLLYFRHDSPLRKKFLEQIVDVSIREKGWKLKRQQDTKGHYYEISSVVSFNEKKFEIPEEQERNFRRQNRLSRHSEIFIAQEGFGTYQYEIVSST